MHLSAETRGLNGEGPSRSHFDEEYLPLGYLALVSPHGQEEGPRPLHPDPSGSTAALLCAQVVHLSNRREISQPPSTLAACSRSAGNQG